MMPLDNYGNCLPGLATESGASGTCHFLERAMEVGEALATTELGFNLPPGTLLFFIELFRRTNEHKYLQLVEQALDILLQSFHKRYTGNYSLQGGYMGTAFACLQLYKITHREHYMQQALQIAKSCTADYLHEPYATNSLFYGRAGALLVLVHLHQQTGESFLLQSINLFSKRIIRDMEVQKEGLAPGLTGQSIKSPLGLATGTSGLAYLFLELGHYFRNEAFYYLARQLFAYEDQYWDQDKKCWPDLRKEVSNEYDFLLHRKNFETGNHRFFTKPGFNFSMAHGIAGMAMARARAFQLTNEAPYLEQLSQCVNQVYSYYEKEGLFFLPENSADAGLLFLEAYRVTKENRFLQLAWHLTDQCETPVNESELFREKAFSPGFHSDLTGMGYLYLQLTDPAGNGLAIAPRLMTSCKRSGDIEKYPVIAIKTQEAIKKILKQSFAKTIYVLEQIAPQALNEYLSLLGDGPIGGGFGEWMAKIIPGLRNREQAMLTDVYGIELAKLDLYNGIESGALLHMQEVYRQETVNDLLALKSGAFLNQLLMVTSGWVVKECCYYQQLNNLYVELSDYALNDPPYTSIILKPTVKKEAGEELRVIEKLSSLKTNTSCIQEIVISNLDRELLHIFSAPISIRRAINQLTALVCKTGNDLLSDNLQEPPVTLYSRFLPSNPIVKPVALSPDNIEQVILEKIRTFLNCHILQPL
jgi:hypothetical protein